MHVSTNPPGTKVATGTIFRSPTFGKSRGSWALGFALSLATGCLLLPTQPTLAQAVIAQLIEDTAPDRALGTTITPFNQQIDLITGGTSRGPNLFHSFQEFNIGANRGVYFANPAGIQNILTRITGSNPSNIEGTLGVFGSANLFFLNPNGIIFGPNASLDLRGGSFHGSTASSIKFGNLGEFSATNPQPPAPLLTINPSAYFFTAKERQGEIINRSRATQTVEGEPTYYGLQVPNGQTLLLLGGNVLVDGGGLNAWEGRIEIGAVAGSGTVGLNPNGSLGIPDDVQRADVTFTDRAYVEVTLNNSGNIGVTGKNISVLDGSQLLAGIFVGSNISTSQAGDITLNASDVVRVEGLSEIKNFVYPGASGNSGNIFISAGSLDLDTGTISTSAVGLGNAGNIVLQIQGIASLTNKSFILSNIGSPDRQPTVGNVGNISLTAQSVFMSGTSQLQAGFYANTQGQSGLVSVQASDSVVFTDPNTGIFNDAEEGVIGNGSDIEITARSVSLFNGAVLITENAGQGNAGNIRIITHDQALFQNSVVSSAARKTGDGGSIDITTGSLVLRQGAILTTDTFGKGNAGNVQINALGEVRLEGLGGAISSLVQSTAEGKGGDIVIHAGSLTLLRGSQLDTSTFGMGNSGNILINVLETTTVDGVNSRFPDRSSTIFSEVFVGAEGNGGNIYLSTGSLFVTNGGQLDAKTRGQGNAGSIFITARDQVVFDGKSPIGGKPSRALSAVDEEAIGNGGNITVNARTLSVSGGAQLNALTRGQGRAGNITINAREFVLLDGFNSVQGGSSGLFTGTERLAQGLGGGITVNTDLFRVSNGAAVSAETFTTFRGGDIAINANTVEVSQEGSIVATATNRGNAGNIYITANQIRLTDLATISTSTARSDGGDITINVRDLLLLRRESTISTTAGTAQAGGNGGNITIAAPRGFVVGVKTENSDITANAFTGNGGRVNITVQGVYGLQFRPQLTPFSDITASSTFGISGVVALNILGIDPTRSLFVLPGVPLDPRTRMDERCQFGGRFSRSSFIITGRGGFPSDPFDLLRHEESELQDSDWITLEELGQGRRRKAERREQEAEGGSQEPEVRSQEVEDRQREGKVSSAHFPQIAAPTATEPPIIEANNWIVAPDGTVWLVAEVPAGEYDGFWRHPPCLLQPVQSPNLTPRFPDPGPRSSAPELRSHSTSN